MTKIKTTSAIAEGDEAVLSIYYDEEDGMLIMEGAVPVDELNSITAFLSEIVEREPSLEGIDTLPAGWRASRRDEHSDWSIGPAT